MYKYFLFSCLLFTSVISFAANKIEMVTYFPVPYVAYSKVTPKNQLDIGLTSSCQMNLGCAESGYSLNATTTNLNRNRLDLNSAAAVSSTNVTVGSGYGPSNIDFAQNLRVGALDRGYSLEANTMNVESLTLFASHMKTGGALFPDCRVKSGEDTVSWQKLKLKDKEEVYLMCGTPKESAEKCSDPVKPTWDGTRCVCPGAQDFYINGTCCNTSTPQTDTRCWKKQVYPDVCVPDYNGKATFQPTVGGTTNVFWDITHGDCGGGPNGSHFSCREVAYNDYLNLIRWIQISMVLPWQECGYMNSARECDIYESYAPCIKIDSTGGISAPLRGNGSSTIGYTIYECKPPCNPLEVYLPLWNPETDKNY